MKAFEKKEAILCDENTDDMGFNNVIEFIKKVTTDSGLAKDVKLVASYTKHFGKTV